MDANARDCVSLERVRRQSARFPLNSLIFSGCCDCKMIHEYFDAWLIYGDRETAPASPRKPLRERPHRQFKYFIGNDPVTMFHRSNVAAASYWSAL
jgi:hypothetical protein